jgi:hypothetical protein
MARRRQIHSKKGSNKKMKGGCGCSGEKSQPSFFSGGEPEIMRGGAALGPASFTPSDSANNYTYPYFKIDDSPTNANQIIDARQLPNPSISGGKRRTRRHKTNKRKSKKNIRRSYRKYKGGSDPIIKNYDNNLITNSNTIIGTYTGANIIGANTSDIVKPFSTPVFL